MKANAECHPTDLATQIKNVVASPTKKDSGRYRISALRGDEEQGTERVPVRVPGRIGYTTDLSLATCKGTLFRTNRAASRQDNAKASKVWIWGNNHPQLALSVWLPTRVAHQATASENHHAARRLAPHASCALTTRHATQVPGFNLFVVLECRDFKSSDTTRIHGVVNHVIDVDAHKSIHVVQHVLHETLERCRCVGQADRHIWRPHGVVHAVLGRSSRAPSGLGDTLTPNRAS